MNKFSHFNVKNGMSFGELDLNLDSPGMNLIMGENLDDTSGNSSRNGCGKSNIFTLLNYHLFEQGLDLVNHRSKSAIINSEAGTDYMSSCIWRPSLLTPHFLTSYQYQSYKDWGTGAYLIQNGSWDDYEQGKEGVEDISQWISKDTQRSFQKKLNLNWNEWNLLVNLTNVDDDKDDPFFTNRDKIQRLELFQSLFQMDYSSAHAEVKNRMSDLRRRIEHDSSALEATLNVLNSQLSELPEEAELQATIEKATKAVAQYQAAVSELSSKIETEDAKIQLIAEYDGLKSALIASGIEEALFKNNDVRAQYDEVRANLESGQQAMSDLRVQITQMQQYEGLRNRLDQAEESAKFYIDQGYTLENIRERAAANQAAISKQYRFQQLTSKYSWISEYGSDIQTAASYLLENVQQLVADVNAKLHSLETEKSELSNMRTSSTFIINQLLPKSKRLLVELQAATAALKEQEPNAAFVDAHTQASDARDVLHQLQLKIQTANMELRQIQHKIEHMSSGVCPTCNQNLPDFEDTEKARKDLEDQRDAQQQVVAGLEQEKVQAQANMEALAENANKYTAYANAKTSFEGVNNRILELMDTEEAAKLSDSYLQELEQEEQTKLAEGSKRLSEIDAEQRQLNSKAMQLSSVVSDELTFIIQHTPCDIQKLEAENQQSSSISQTLVSLQDQRSQIQSIQAAVQHLIDQGFSSASLQELLQGHVSYAESGRPYIQWAEAVLPMLANINNSKFDNIESIRWMMDESSTDEDRSSLENMRILLNENQRLLSSTEHSLTQRKNLEARISQQADQNEELTHSRSRFKALQALEIMCGPSGLVYSRLEIIFRELNAIMNNYMSILIPEGVGLNKRVTTYFEMTNNGPIQTVYRGDTPIARLSRSEKARVKLARTLAFREFCLPAKQCNILLLDELDGSSCDTNKERIWECVNSHVERFPSTSVWAVSHSSQMQTSDLWNRKFNVSKAGGYSTLQEV